jgi:hypothetical protein
MDDKRETELGGLPLDPPVTDVRDVARSAVALATVERARVAVEAVERLLLAASTARLHGSSLGRHRCSGRGQPGGPFPVVFRAGQSRESHACRAESLPGRTPLCGCEFSSHRRGRRCPGWRGGESPRWRGRNPPLDGRLSGDQRLESGDRNCGGRGRRGLSATAGSASMRQRGYHWSGDSRRSRSPIAVARPSDSEGWAGIG